MIITMKKSSKFKKVQWCIILILVPIMIYLLIDVGSAAEVFKQYDSIKGGTSSSFSRRLIFLNSYIQTTGDLSVGQTVGLSPDELEEMRQYTGYGNSSSVNTKFPSGDIAEQIRQLKNNSSYNNTYYSKCIKEITVNGSILAWEKQERGAWSSFSPNEVSMSAAGCFYYATCALIGAKTGSIYTIEQLLTNMGGEVITSNSGEFTVTRKPIANLSGSREQLQRCLNAAASYNSAISGAVVSEVNKGVFEADASDGGELAKGSCMYIVYQRAHPAKASDCKLSSYHAGSCGKCDTCNGTGYCNHWTAVVGKSDGKCIVLGNGDRDYLVDVKEFKNITYYYKVTFK